MNKIYKNDDEKKNYFAYIEECSKYTYLIQRIEALKIWKYYSGEAKVGNSLTSTVELGELDFLRLGKDIEAELIRKERLEKINLLKTELLASWDRISRNIYFKRLPIKITQYHENSFF